MTIALIFIGFSVMGLLSLPAKAERAEREHVHFSSTVLEWYFHSNTIGRDVAFGALLFFPLAVAALFVRLAFEVASPQLLFAQPVWLCGALVAGLLVGHLARRIVWPYIVRTYGVGAPVVQQAVQGDGPASGGPAP